MTSNREKVSAIGAFSLSYVPHLETARRCTFERQRCDRLGAYEIVGCFCSDHLPIFHYCGLRKCLESSSLSNDFLSYDSPENQPARRVPQFFARRFSCH